MKKQTYLAIFIIAGLLAVVLYLQSSNLAAASPLLRPLLQSGAPAAVSYQGYVEVSGVEYNGSGYFKFAVVDSAGTTSYWSNDGTSTVADEPAAAVTLSVTGGLFQVYLGDTSLGGMTQTLSASAFDGTDRTLRVWFSTDNVTFDLLSPDRPITAVPYALQAEEAKNADTLDTLDSSAFWQLGGNAGATPVTNYLGTSDAVSLTLATNGTAAMTIDTAGYVGLGTNIPTERLTVRGNTHVLGQDDPVASGYTSTNLSAPFSVFVAGHYAYVASYNNDRLAIFDVSDPANPVATGTTSANLNSPTSVFVAGRYAYVASSSNSRLAIFDVSDPANPVAAGYTGANLNVPQSVFVAGRYAYVASFGNNSLAIFDVSDPANPVAAGTTSTNLSYPYSVFVAGGYAYVASFGNIGNNYLAIFDVSDPTNPVAAGYTSANLDGPQSVFVAGRYAYVASRNNSRLVIFDVSDPANPVATGYTSANLNSPYSVFVAGGYAYVASYYNSRLAIFDVSDPANPVAAGYTGTNLNRPYSVFVAGRYAYVASRSNSRLSIFELNHLEAPTAELGSLHTGGLHVGESAVVGDQLNVLGSLNVGQSAMVNGDLAVNGEATFTDYVQLDTVSSAPPSTDCDETSEAGRMTFDPTSDILYICSGVSGWVTK